jgi:hypothetical protein
MKQRLLFCLLFISTFIFNETRAQSIEEQMTKKRPTCNEVFLNAMELLPKLYRNKSLDSMYLAIEIWKQSCGNDPEVQCSSLLLAMEQSTFSIDSVNNNTIDLLTNYAKSFYYYQQQPTRYPEVQISFYRLCSVWAKLLLEQNALDENEKFICKVFNGEIVDPVKEIKNNPETYRQLAVFLKKKEAGERKGNHSNYALLTGIWLPQDDLYVLGNHPSIGFQFGYKAARDQIDFTLQFRFMKSTNTYQVSRNGYLYGSDAYFGGYIGVDYTYYLVTKLKYELGTIGRYGI